MAAFTYNDIVTAKPNADPNLRPGQRAWIIAVMENRQHFPLREFSPGTVYSMEFEDGDAVDAHEDDLILVESASPTK